MQPFAIFKKELINYNFIINSFIEFNNNIFKKSLENKVGDQVNYFMGLRTKNSMKMKGIEFDSRIFVKFSIKFSYWFLPLGIIWTIFDIIFGISITSLIIQFILFIILLIFIIVITEKRLKIVE